ncbi:MAG: diaminopimelate decarboxylase [Verrucomicrobiota bacterium]
MHSFHYHDTRLNLHCEGVDLQQLAEQYGTPLYVYSKATFLDHFRRLDQALTALNHEIAYAVKANSNLAILNFLAKEGSGFDIVSGGELHRVKIAGGDPRKCTFAGVGKSREEIEFALNEEIYSFNVESEAEIQTLNTIAGKLGVSAPVAIRINPNVDARTHKYISTGKSENKFGIDFDAAPDAYDRAAQLPHIEIRGVQMHIGSQLTTLDPFVEAVDKVIPLVESLRDQYQIEFFSIGGGIGIVYEDSLPSGSPDWWHGKNTNGASPLTIDEYAAALVPLLKPLNLKILLEPGRMIAGNAGVLITRVLYTKKGAAKTFQIIDAGMNDLIRPALYQGHHDIVPLQNPGSRYQRETVDIVGPVCESGDFFAQNRDLPPLQENDLIAVLSAGAYGFVMASNYNTRPFPPEILVDGNQAHLIRPRQSYDDLTASESIPT